jgi:hypothetical protein
MHNCRRRVSDGQLAAIVLSPQRPWNRMNRPEHGTGILTGMLRIPWIHSCRPPGEGNLRCHHVCLSSVTKIYKSAECKIVK